MSIESANAEILELKKANEELEARNRKLEALHQKNSNTHRLWLKREAELRHLLQRAEKQLEQVSKNQQEQERTLQENKRREDALEIKNNKLTNSLRKEVIHYRTQAARRKERCTLLQNALAEAQTLIDPNWQPLRKAKKRQQTPNPTEKKGHKTEAKTFTAGESPTVAALQASHWKLFAIEKRLVDLCTHLEISPQRSQTPSSLRWALPVISPLGGTDIKAITAAQAIRELENLFGQCDGHLDAITRVCEDWGSDRHNERRRLQKQVEALEVWRIQHEGAREALRQETQQLKASEEHAQTQLVECQAKYTALEAELQTVQTQAGGGGGGGGPPQLDLQAQLEQAQEAVEREKMRVAGFQLEILTLHKQIHDDTTLHEELIQEARTLLQDALVALSTEPSHEEASIVGSQADLSPAVVALQQRIYGVRHKLEELVQWLTSPIDASSSYSLNKSTNFTGLFEREEESVHLNSSVLNHSRSWASPTQSLSHTREHILQRMEMAILNDVDSLSSAHDEDEAYLFGDHSNIDSSETFRTHSEATMWVPDHL